MAPSAAGEPRLTCETCEARAPRVCPGESRGGGRRRDSRAHGTWWKQRVTHRAAHPERSAGVPLRREFGILCARAERGALSSSGPDGWSVTKEGGVYLEYAACCRCCCSKDVVTGMPQGERASRLGGSALEQSCATFVPTKPQTWSTLDRTSVTVVLRNGTRF